MQSDSVKKIAVIGASGFIGLRLVELLANRTGPEVIPLVRSASSLAVLARRPMSWKITSFFDEANLAAALESCDVCVHAAIGDAAQIVQMAQSAYQACASAGVRRLVWLSSASVHGQNCPPGTDESAPLKDDQPLTYNNAKVRAEWALKKLSKDRRVEVVRLRPGVVFGPRSRWIADAANDIRASRACWIRGGHGICNSIYVDNLAEAIRLAAVSPGAAGEAFLIGDKETVTWRDFLVAIAQHLGSGESAFAEVSALTFAPERTNWSDRITMTPAYRRVGDMVPDRFKRVTKAVLRALPNPPPGPSAWTYRYAKPAPRLSHEHTLLQQCAWKFPNAHAVKLLGYNAPVTFAEGMRRSLDWLDFVEGRHRGRVERT
jgi:nucleoside-diphosphate-sugar epimerase